MGSMKEKLQDSVIGSVFINRNFWICVLINIINKMGRSCASQPIKLLGNSIGMAASLIGLATSCYYICSMLIRSPFGTLLDKLQKKKVLTAAFLIQGGSFLLYMVVDTPAMFFIAKAIEGFGFGMAHMAMTAIVASTSSKKAMGSALGLLSMLPFVLASLSNYITLQVRTMFGEKYSFIGAAACVAVCILLSWLLRFEKSEAEVKEVHQVSKKERARLISFYALPTALVMIAVIIPTLLSDNFLAIYGETAGLPFYAAFLSVYMVANGISSGVVGFFRDKFGTKATVYPVIISGIVGTAILGFSTNQILWTISSVLMGIAGGGMLIICRAQAVLNSPKSEISLAIATNVLVMDAASIVINPLGGAIADTLGYANLFKIAAVLPMLALIVTIVFFKKLFGETSKGQ